MVNLNKYYKNTSEQKKNNNNNLALLEYQIKLSPNDHDNFVSFYCITAFQFVDCKWQNEFHSCHRLLTSMESKNPGAGCNSKTLN